MNFKNDGQSLLEVIIAMAIAMLVVTGLVKMSVSSIRTANFSSEQTQATNIAQKKLTDLVDESHIAPDTFFEGLPRSSQETIDIYCMLTEISDASPPPKMVLIKLTIFWELKGSSTSCNSSIEGKNNYKNSLHFETYVTD